MVFYLDISALLKRYVRETGSTWVTALYAPNAGHTLATGLITKAEAIAALAAKQRRGGISLNDYQRAESDLRHDFVHTYSIVEIDEPLVDLAANLAKQQRLRGYDAVQLAAALTLQTILLTANLPGLTFLSADTLLLAAAQQEALTTDNPDLYP